MGLPLLLSSAQAYPTLAHICIQSIGEPVDEVAVGLLSRFPNLLPRGCGPSISNVFTDGSSKEHWFLTDDGDLLPPPAQVQCAQVVSINQDLAMLRVVVAQKQGPNRALA